MKFFAFDWDDNIFKHDTSIILIHKETSKEVELNTEQFAKVRKKIGHEGKYKNYELSSNLPDFDNNYSFKNFMDNNNYEINRQAHKIIKDKEKVYFQDMFLLERNGEKILSPKFKNTDKIIGLKKVEQMLIDVKNSVEKMSVGASFKDLIEALNSKKSSERTFVITARAQSPETIYECLTYLKMLKIIKFIPPLKNLIPVTHQTILKKLKLENETAQHVSLIKLKVLYRILDNLSNKKQEISFGFSDDDKETFELVKDFLEKKSFKKHVKINLYLTETEKIKHVIQ